MPAVRLAAVFLAMLAFAPAADAAVSAPANLKPFLLRADEAPARVFPRTPSFAWRPVRGARNYEFELATRSNFTDGSIVWSGTTKMPTVAIPISLPWMTGTPYALWARVRAVTRRSVSRWASPYGFNMRWSAVPQSQPSTVGLVRWNPVEGATGYNVWFTRPNKVIATKTNVADEREHWTFHQGAPFANVVEWRVRAVRTRVGVSANGIPAVSYGPWSQRFVELNPPVSLSRLGVSTMASDAFSNQPTAFRLMPSLSYDGTLSADDVSRELYRVYITTDSDCVNVVYRGSIVGSPAWAPRVTGALVLPATQDELLKARAGWIISDGKQGKTFAIDNSAANENESKLPGGSTGGTGGTGDTGGTGGTGGAGTEEQIEKVESAALSPPLVDLWDNGWPENRYYWTVVGVRMRGGIGDPNSIEYIDTELPQDACAAGRVSTFGKVSEAVVTTSGAPYVSGLSPNGTLFSASRKRPVVYGTPLVAWKPALGADRYEVQWSKRAYPWTKKGSIETPATSALLPLGTSGVWYYRVRGISLALPFGGRQMSWSNPVAIRVSGPRFRIVRR
jgi:hypothetical protein